MATDIDTSKRIAVVTGGNRGIGLEMCRQLACNNDIIVVLTSRDENRGNEVINDLKSSGLLNIIYHQLDIMDSASIFSLAHYIKTQFGKLDILVNNAGVNGVIVDEESFPSLQLQSGDVVGANSKLGQKVAIQTYETAEDCIRTNYFGPKQLIQALIPLLMESNSARIVNISSKLGQLKEFSIEWVVKVLSDVDGLTEEKIDEFVNSFLKDAKDDLLEKNGWPNILSAYKVSKAALNAHTRILARKFPYFSINAITPGYVKTDMSFYKGNISVEEGAKGPLMLALMPNGGWSLINYYGTKRVTEELLPFLQFSKSASIVNVSSVGGQLSCILDEKIKSEQQNVDSLTEEKIDKILETFLRDFKEEKLKANGWPITTLSAYKVSKVSVNAYTRLLAKKIPEIIINCVHPGYVVTDITKKTGPMTPEQGARAPVMVALLPDGSPLAFIFVKWNCPLFSMHF